ncbi:lipid droplet-associated hydrolase isoform X3 [Dendroctonus ponderosae]|uniref:lipid droplet-associated hydrolase isoform X3 n=1 Tax=Dendroctonus ponderosae TaxID=77166 RepID=UPI0020354919|nr:lipid droplet-associated hydrolase isoform X3 [Dendroctonus ponderosae]
MLILIVSMNEAFVEVNGVRTKIATWGRWIEESPATIKELIILIPGNPGVVGFYKQFANSLYEKTDIPVWCLSHAGHNLAENSITKLPNFTEHRNLYGLKGQVKHKVDFLEKYLPHDAKVYLIGHSIGSYMALEVLNYPGINSKIIKTYLLFPTIERMAVTKNAFEEMDQVLERNDKILHDNIDKVKLYYGKTDGWAPEEFYGKIKQDLPNVDAELTNICHTFVFNHSVDVAATVCKWIKSTK